MIEFTIAHVTPWLVGGKLCAIGFMLTAKDGDIAEEVSHQGPATLPERDEPYGDEDFKAKCDAIADDKGLKELLRRRIVVRQSRPVFTLPAPPVLSDADKRAMWMASVDSAVESILRRHTRFQMGYTEREAAARAYIASGGAIEPTVWITRFADNVGMPYAQAAALILQQAAQLRAALVQLEALRMDKYLIERASTIEFAEGAHKRIVDEITAIGESLK